MSFVLSELNRRVITDPRGFVAECEELYHKRIENAAAKIIDNLPNSPIVLLSGPSGSGKTTTAMKIEEELERRGIKSHAIAMDNYFNTITPETMPRTPEGDYDYESPYCLDIDLLNAHFGALARRECIHIPKYEFARHIRVMKPSKSLRLKKDEIVVFEGIHALNDMFTMKHPKAFKLHISARSSVIDHNDDTVFESSWLRLTRRTVRDSLYRGTDANATLGMWDNVRRGEKLYIDPFKDKADLMLDTTFPFEVNLMSTIAPQLFDEIPKAFEKYPILAKVRPAFDRFEGLSRDLLPENSLLREFIGDGSYSY